MECFIVDVLTQFPNVAVHVVKPELVGGLGAEYFEIRKVLNVTWRAGTSSSKCIGPSSGLPIVNVPPGNKRRGAGRRFGNRRGEAIP